MKLVVQRFARQVLDKHLLDRKDELGVAQFTLDFANLNSRTRSNPLVALPALDRHLLPVAINALVFGDHAGLILHQAFAGTVSIPSANTMGY